jgi:membrane protease subunit HflC
VGWTIRDPRAFFNSFPTGTPQAAQPALESIVRATKQAVIGQHPFSDFVSTDPKQVKFSEIEKEIADGIRASAKDKYGIEIQFLGIKRIGLPESVTQEVFKRMQSERQRVVDALKAQGDAEATKIRSTADRERDEILARARGEATTIRGQAEAEAAKSYDTLKQDPELAIFLIKLQALEQTLREKATLIVDPRTPPFDLLTRPGETTPKSTNGSLQNAVGAQNTLSENGAGTSK